MWTKTNEVINEDFDASKLINTLRLSGLLKTIKQELGEEYSWNNAFVNIKRSLFLVLLFVSLAGVIMDITLVGTYVNSYVYYFNLVHIGIGISLFALYLLKLINVHTAFAVIVYTIVLDIFLSLNFYHVNFDEFFLRETIFIGIVIMLSGFVHRLHLIIIGVVYLCYFLLALFISRSPFLIDNAPILLVTFVSFQILLFYLFSLFEYGYLVQMKLDRQLKDSYRELDRQNKKIQESEEKYRIITEYAGDFIGVINVEGNISFSSPSIKALLGYSVQEVLGEDAADFVHQDDISKINAYFKSMFETGSAELAQFRFKHKNGHYIWVESTAEMLPGNKQMVTINRDISERKQMERKLIKAINTKDHFFSIIAHDLKSPMAQMFSTSRFLHERYDTVDNKDRKALIDSMYKGAAQMSNLLDDLLLWARAQMDTIPVKKEKHKVKNILSETMGIFSEQIKQKGIRINTSSSESVVVADINSVKTILRNLLSNAIKFSQIGGDIVLLVKEKDDKVKISVADFGVGIPHENVESLFSVGQSFSTPGTQNEKGTGLGLIICQELAVKNGGELTVESELNKGSKFTLVLPSA